MGNICRCEAMCGDDKLTQSSITLDLRAPYSADVSENLEYQDSPLVTGVTSTRPYGEQSAGQVLGSAREARGLYCVKVTGVAGSQLPKSPVVRPTSISRRAKTGNSWGLKRPVKSKEPSIRIEDREQEDVLIEGEIFKVKPGSTKQSTSRWAQLTCSEFRYYKNQWNAHCWLNKPLLALALTEVREVKK
jgi:hypothetical protein